MALSCITFFLEALFYYVYFVDPLWSWFCYTVLHFSNLTSIIAIYVFQSSEGFLFLKLPETPAQEVNQVVTTKYTL